MRFGPFNIGYPGLASHAEAAGLTTENKWELIYDFTDTYSNVKKDEGDVSKNHGQIAPEEWST